MRRYSELIQIPTFEERFEYLKLGAHIGEETFGFDRYLNQVFYKSKEWESVRNHVIVRDNGCDLAMDGHDIFDRIIVHHMNPISLKDIDKRNLEILDPEFLISVSLNTHNAIHYGDVTKIANRISERLPNDTCPWRV